MGKRCIVTGGGGFLGRALCLELIRQGHQVTSISRGLYPELKDYGVQTVQADLSESLEHLLEIFSGVEVVFHVAANVKLWGRYQEFHRGNVVSTENVIRICQQVGVPYLVYTSSPSVIADGSDLEGVDESIPYPKNYHAYYPMTKAIAERMVLKASNQSLKSLSLRPHLIWGPGDTSLVPAILERARQGRLVQVGAGQNLVDTTYIDDCVDAHLCAWSALAENPEAAGRAYFISQGEPVNLWAWIAEILERNNLPPIKKQVSAGLAYAAASILELFARIKPSCPEPMFTRFLVAEMSTSHYFDISAARCLLKYEPGRSFREGMELTFARNQR